MYGHSSHATNTNGTDGEALLKTLSRYSDSLTVTKTEEETEDVPNPKRVKTEEEPKAKSSKKSSKKKSKA